MHQNRMPGGANGITAFSPFQQENLFTDRTYNTSSHAIATTAGVLHHTG